MHCRKRRNWRKPCGFATITDFGVCFVIFILILSLPILDVMASYMAGLMAWYAVQQATVAAANAHTYGEALSNARSAAHEILSCPVSRCVGLRDSNEKNGSALNLYVTVTDVKKQISSAFGPNAPLTKPIDDAANLYQYSLSMKFEVAPVLPLSFIPGLKNVGMLGKSTLLSFHGERAVEHVDGLGNL